jgi:cell division protein FtsQ
MKKKIIGYILIGICIILVLSYLVYAKWVFSDNDSDIICNDLQIEFIDDNKTILITESDIAKIIDAKGLNPIGVRYENIYTERIEKVLLKNRIVKNVECYKTQSGIVRLEVRQRSPKFIIAAKENFYVDTDRELFPLSMNNAIYVPVVSGRITKSFATGELFDFIDYLEKDQFWNAQIEQVFITDDLKIEMIPRVSDAVILLGTLDKYEDKLERLAIFYQKGLNVLGWNRYHSIDLQYDNQIVCKKKTKQMKPVIIPVEINDSTGVKPL